MAIIAHEVPQEVGDFAILLESGYSRPRALVFNALARLAKEFGDMFFLNNAGSQYKLL